MSAPVKTFINNSAPQCEATDLNAYQNEINNIILGAGIALNDSTTNQAIESIIKLVASANYYEYSGTANAIVLTKLGGRDAASGYFDGMRAAFIATTANTGAVTINIDGLGAKTVETKDGDALTSGDLVGFCEVVFRSADDVFYLVSSGVSGQYFPSYDTTIDYPIGSIARYSGETYIRVKGSGTVADPSASDDYRIWTDVFFAYELAQMAIESGDMVVYPRVYGESAASTGDYTVAPTGTTHLIIDISGVRTLVKVSETVSGSITALDSSALTATIGSTSVTLTPINLTALYDLTVNTDNLFSNVGYATLPNGLILQWGNVTVSADSSAVVTFPLAFPTACHNGQASLGASFGTSTDAGVSIFSLTTTGATVRSGYESSILVRYFVIGH